MACHAVSDIDKIGESRIINTFTDSLIKSLQIHLINIISI